MQYHLWTPLKREWHDWRDSRLQNVVGMISSPNNVLTCVNLWWLLYNSGLGNINVELFSVHQWLHKPITNLKYSWDAPPSSQRPIVIDSWNSRKLNPGKQTRLHITDVQERSQQWLSAIRKLRALHSPPTYCYSSTGASSNPSYSSAPRASSLCSQLTTRPDIHASHTSPPSS